MLTKISPRHRRGRYAGVAALALADLSAAGCGSGASSAGAQASSQGSSAISGLASQAGTAGPVTIGSDGRAGFQLTVHNPTSEAHDHPISVAFDDPSAVEHGA